VKPVVVDAKAASGWPSSNPDNVVGRVMVHPVSPALGTVQVKVNAVYLEPGSRFRPHKHPYDQVLYNAYGTGLVAVDGGDDIVVPGGQYVLLPAGTVHMHGCTDDAPALQISIMREVETTFDVPYPSAWEKWRKPAG
jgi:quercetin dioxygenase-like cupin family protein